MSFAGSSVRIEYSGRAAEEMIDFLFRGIPQSGGPEPHVTLRLDGTEDANSIQELVARHLSDKSQGGLLFHAAAVASTARCLLLPGPSGTGKTTLTSWLVKGGFTYLTDELAYVPFGSRQVQGLTRPLNVKHPTDLSNSRRVTLVPPSALGEAGALRPGELAAMVFPRYRAGADLDLTRLSRAQAGLELMACLINARNLQGHGFTEVTRLANDIPARRLTYGAFEQIEDWMQELKRSFNSPSV